MLGHLLSKNFRLRLTLLDWIYITMRTGDHFAWIFETKKNFSYILQFERYSSHNHKHFHLATKNWILYSSICLQKQFMRFSLYISPQCVCVLHWDDLETPSLLQQISAFKLASSGQMCRCLWSIFVDRHPQPQPPTPTTATVIVTRNSIGNLQFAICNLCAHFYNKTFLHCNKLVFFPL